MTSPNKKFLDYAREEARQFLDTPFADEVATAGFLSPYHLVSYMEDSHTQNPDIDKHLTIHTHIKPTHAGLLEMVINDAFELPFADRKQRLECMREFPIQCRELLELRESEESAVRPWLTTHNYYQYQDMAAALTRFAEGGKPPALELLKEGIQTLTTIRQFNSQLREGLRKKLLDDMDMEKQQRHHTAYESTEKFINGTSALPDFYSDDIKAQLEIFKNAYDRLSPADEPDRNILQADVMDYVKRTVEPFLESASLPMTVEDIAARHNEHLAKQAVLEDDVRNADDYSAMLTTLINGLESIRTTLSHKSHRQQPASVNR